MASVLLVLGMFFGMFMFIFAMMAQGNDGLFPWQRGQDSKDRLNEIYEECKDESSSLSVIFFNINTDQNRMHQCLEKTAASYFGLKDYQIIAFDIPIEFKKIILESKGSNYNDAIEESNLRHAAFVKTWDGAQHFIPEYYRTCQKDTSLLTLGPFMFLSNKDKAQECFIERHEEVVDAFSLEAIRSMKLRSSAFYEEEDIIDILISIKTHEKKREELKKELAATQSANIAAETTNENGIVKRCPHQIDLQSYPAALEVTDFTDSNYGGVYQLDGTYNCNPKWTNFTCGKHGDGTDIQCYLFLTPATKSGTWVIQPSPPSIEWQAGGYFNCPGMPWESCSPGWIGGKSVTIKK